MDYIEAAGGKKAGYVVAWYLSTVYYSILTYIIAFVYANYFCSLIGLDYGQTTWLVAFGFLTLSFALNIWGPKIEGNYQV